MTPVLGFIGSIGPWEIIVLLGLGLLIFGKRLPEVGKSLGKGIVEFKKGLAGIEDEIDTAGQSSQAKTQDPSNPPQSPTSLPPQSISRPQSTASDSHTAPVERNSP